MKTIEVVAAIIQNNNQILCVQRGPSKYAYVSHKYEFPGGKVEAGETKEQAIIREIKEELHIDIINPQFYLIATYNINKYTFINLFFRLVLLLLIYIMRDSAYIIQISLLGTGIVMLLLNAFYLKSIFFQEGLSEYYPSTDKLLELLKTNSLIFA